MDKVRDLGRVVTEDPGTHHVSGKRVRGSDKDVASLDLSVEARTSFERVDSIDYCERPGQRIDEPRYHKVQVFLGVGTVASFPGIDVHETFEVLYPKAHDCLGVSLEHGDVHDKVAVDEVCIEIERDTIPQVHLLKRSVVYIDALHTVTGGQEVVTQRLKGFGRALFILRVKHDHAFAYGYVTDPTLLE